MSFFWSFFFAPQSSRLWRRRRKAPECFHSVLQAGQAMCARPASDETSTRPTSWRDLLRYVSFLHEERTPHYDSMGNALSCFEAMLRKEYVLCQSKTTRNWLVVMLSAGIRETSRFWRSCSPPTSSTMILTDPTFAAARTTNIGSPRVAAFSPIFISRLISWSLRPTRWLGAGPSVAPIRVISSDEHPLLPLASR